MNISYKWLQRYLNITDDAEQVAKNLTSIGLEVGTVEKVESIKGGLKGLVVAEVLTCEPHPNSDHLHITTVRLSETDEPVQIVCGAPNVAQGQKVICATLGTILYQGDESFTIKRSKIRGVESFGMLCAEDEIGIGTSHDGIIVLPQEAVVGTPAKEYYHIEDDYVIEVDITPNRSDAISHYGVARDLYAFYKSRNCEVELKRPSVDDFRIDNEELKINVRVENHTACPRYSGVSIKGVTIKESPDWLKNALNTIGLKPINNVVDATNYVLHEFGQALHAFDADKIAGQQVIVKNVQQDTPFVTLDGIERKLDSQDLMICNEQEPMCLAGVFGGLKSGISAETKNIFLESAYFNPVSIRKTARRHGLSTDASFRYERGCDPNNTIYVLKRCALLIKQLGGGTISMPIVDILDPEMALYQKDLPFAPFEVELSYDYLTQIIGKEIGKTTVELILKSLEMQASPIRNGVWKVLVPPYRTDVTRPCDVAEDILRIYGYNNVEMSEKLHSNLAFSQSPDPVRLQTLLSEQLTAQGFNEILNNSLTRQAYYEQNDVYPLENCVKVKNPLSSDLAVMRQTLLYGGLESIARNLNRQQTNLRFYEFGNCYHFDSEKHTDDNPLAAYSEKTHFALWMTGNLQEQTWLRKEEKTTFYTLLAIVKNLMRRLGIDVQNLSMQEFNNSLFADGLVLSTRGGKSLGCVAIVRKVLLKEFDINEEVLFADLDWHALLKQNKQYKVKINDLPRFPEVRRDLALLLQKSVNFEDLRLAALQTEKKLLKDVFLFDVYEGKNLPLNFKSYAIAFVLQDEQNTLKDKQIDSVMQRLQKTFEDKFEAKLR